MKFCYVEAEELAHQLEYFLLAFGYGRSLEGAANNG
jgi:hypothetical protein